jgi:Clostripain family
VAEHASDSNHQPKWTVMVFMGTHTIHGETSLADAARDDIEEMRSIGSGNGLNIFVQVHGDEPTPTREHIHRGKADPRPVPPAQQRLENAEALSHFIETSLETAGHDEGDHTMLVLWGHAYDFAIGRRPTAGGLIDPLDFAELSGALRSLQDRLQFKYKMKSRPQLDIVGFDACDLATVEVAVQLSSFAKYLLASQMGVPIPGWPYDVVLDRLRHPKGHPMDGSELGSYIVRRYCESYPPSGPVSLTLLNLELADEVFVHVQVMALLLASALADPDTCNRMFDLFSHSQTSPRKPYVDLADLCVGLMRDDGNAPLVQAARALGNLLAGARPEGLDPTPKPFVVEHGCNSGEGARLNGVSIYAPQLVPELDAVAARVLYQRLEFAADTVWSETVHSLLRARLTAVEENE